MSKTIKIAGQRFGMLTVLSDALKYSEAGTNPKVQCKCDCGKIIWRVKHALAKTKVPSCGCAPNPLKREYTKTPLNISWVQFRYYKRMCPEWEKFEVLEAFAKSKGYDNSYKIQTMDKSGIANPESVIFIEGTRTSGHVYVNTDIGPLSIAECADIMGVSRQRSHQLYSAELLSPRINKILAESDAE